MGGNRKVRVRCDVLLRVIEELDDNLQLQDIFGKPVTEALVIAAEDGDLRIENGGGVNLAEGQRRRFLEILGHIVKNRLGDVDKENSGRTDFERVRIRCDVLASIVKELGSSQELKELFGGEFLDALVVVADGGDIRIENSGNVKITEAQSGIFNEILNRIISDNTG